MGNSIKGSNTDPTNQQVGKYTIGKKLGSGNGSDAYAAKDRSKFGLSVCAKIVARGYGKKDEEVSNELNILGKLRHVPNAITLCDVAYWGKLRTPVLITELCPGGELFFRIQEHGKMAPADCVMLFRELLKTVRAVHDCGYLHRNIQPENIFLLSTSLKNYTFRLGGFSLAARMEVCTDVCGAPGYVAPEIISKLAYGPPADVFSLGVVFFICLFGYPPFYSNDGNDQVVFRQIKSGNADFNNVPASAPRDAVDFCHSIITVVDPSRRPTIEQLLCHPFLNGGGQGDATAQGSTSWGSAIATVDVLDQSTAPVAQAFWAPASSAANAAFAAVTVPAGCLPGSYVQVSRPHQPEVHAVAVVPEGYVEGMQFGVTMENVVYVEASEPEWISKQS
jgi:serine/threonine protein kinase